MKSKLKIAFISSEDPLDRKTWSGTHFQIFKALENQFETVEAITYNNKFYKILGVINKITSPIFNKKYNHHHSYLRSFIQSKGIKRKLKKNDFDFIFCCAGSTEIAFLKTDIPIIYLSDSSFGQLTDYYDFATNLFNFSLKESNIIEYKALSKATKIIYPTNWAKDFVVSNYQINSKKIHQVHLGANIDEKDIIYKEKKYDKSKVFKILFLGVYWERKGGDIVLETLKLLNEKKQNIHLTICGSTPTNITDNTTIIPFLDKNNPKDFKKLNQLLQDTHLLFVPTRAECYGIVFNEAAAYGIPVLTSKTGGVPEIITDNFNGYSLPLDKKANDYLEIILKIMDNASLYKTLSLNARLNYINENNWSVFGKKIRRIIENS